jgi:hypothetical protein
MTSGAEPHRNDAALAPDQENDVTPAPAPTPSYFLISKNFFLKFRFSSGSGSRMENHAAPAPQHLS